MARPKRSSKSDQIRKELATGVKSPKAIVESLAKRRIKVSAALVCQVKLRESVASGREPLSVGNGLKLGSADVAAVLSLRRLIVQYGAEQVKLVVDEVASLTA